MRRTLLLALVLSAPPPAAFAQDAAAPFHAIIDRPLFDPDRRAFVPPPPPPPPPPVVAAPAPPPPETPLPTLLGVAMGGERTIVLLRGADGQVVRLAEGEAVDGWRIVSVEARAVEVERDGVRQSLSLSAPPSL